MCRQLADAAARPQWNASGASVPWHNLKGATSFSELMMSGLRQPPVAEQARRPSNPPPPKKKKIHTQTHLYSMTAEHVSPAPIGLTHARAGMLNDVLRPSRSYRNESPAPAVTAMHPRLESQF
jgi:hypothetical protein